MRGSGGDLETCKKFHVNFQSDIPKWRRFQRGGKNKMKKVEKFTTDLFTFAFWLPTAWKGFAAIFFFFLTSRVHIHWIFRTALWLTWKKERIYSHYQFHFCEKYFNYSITNSSFSFSLSLSLNSSMNFTNCAWTD